MIPTYAVYASIYNCIHILIKIDKILIEGKIIFC